MIVGKPSNGNKVKGFEVTKYLFAQFSLSISSSSFKLCLSSVGCSPMPFVFVSCTSCPCCSCIQYPDVISLSSHLSWLPSVSRALKACFYELSTGASCSRFVSYFCALNRVPKKEICSICLSLHVYIV